MPSSTAPSNTLRTWQPANSKNARQAHIQYQRGNALAALGRKDQAIAAWKLAASEPPSKETRIEEARKRAQQALDPSAR